MKLILGFLKRTCCSHFILNISLEFVCFLNEFLLKIPFQKFWDFCLPIISFKLSQSINEFWYKFYLKWLLWILQQSCNAHQRFKRKKQVRFKCLICFYTFVRQVCLTILCLVWRNFAFPPKPLVDESEYVKTKYRKISGQLSFFQKILNQQQLE